MPQATLSAYFPRAASAPEAVAKVQRKQFAGANPASSSVPVVEPENPKPLGKSDDSPAEDDSFAQPHTSPVVSRAGKDVKIPPWNLRGSSSAIVSLVEAQGSYGQQLHQSPDTKIPVLPIRHGSRATVGPVSSAHLPAIQRLTSTILPVQYRDNFYQSTVTDRTTAQLSRALIYGAEPVGWIRCRLENCRTPEATSSDSVPFCISCPQQIYIQALCVLAPYRDQGFATALLDAVLGSDIAKAPNVVSIYAHVWEKNDSALDWYAKRGFGRVILLEHYYRRLRPAGAWILRKDLE